MPTPAPFTQTRWSLADLFPSADGPELEAAFSQLNQLVAEFEKIRPQLSDEMEQAELLSAIHSLEAINRLGNRVGAFASLLFSGSTQDQAAQSLLARVEQFSAELSNQLLFFGLWWKDVGEDAAARLMAGAGDYRYWLEEMRHYKPHTLSEAEEKVLNIKNVTGSSAFNMLYETITNRYIFKVEVGGETREMTRGELMSLVRQTDPDLRARAYQELYRVYGEDGPILAQIYQTLVRDWRNENLGLRKYASPISARNLANDIPDEVVETLLEVARQNVGIFQRFFRLKARLLGVERLRRYDL
jgi:oligoendopeptidase F